MSRIGRMPVEIPAGVTVTVNGNTVTVKGPKGTLTKDFSERITVAVEGNQVLVTRPTDEKEDRSLHGLTRALVQNMVTGVSQGYKKVLMIIGVGYKAVKTGKDLQLYLGYSLMPGVGTPQAKYIISDTDTVKLSVPNEGEIKAQGIDKMTTEKVSGGLIIVVEGIDKQEVGQMAAVIRGKRPPEPYHGKGIRYIDEYVRRKAGKTGK
ncbi:MAG: 50S ribosomal protein L6 [Clostridia bacterium]|nr:50S ribosomal protein L6 [Clostridia bacterium]